jgi:lysozyme
MDKYSYIQTEEGFRAKVYHDSRGIPTIGFGQRVDELELNESEAQTIMARKAAAHEAFLVRLPWYKPLGEPRKAAVLSMTYQLGDAGFMEFRNFIRLMGDGNFAAAADAMLLSEWAKQTPNRAHRAALMIRNGEWPQW